MSLGLLEIREVCRRLLARGLTVDSFAPRIAILVNCRMDLVEEIAKIRATRRLFARMMREEFGATDPRSWSVNIAVHTSGLTLTAAQPANTIVRGAVPGCWDRRPARSPGASWKQETARSRRPAPGSLARSSRCHP